MVFEFVNLTCPVITPSQASQLAHELFGISCIEEPKSLGSCQDANFRIRCHNESGTRLSYVLKVANKSTPQPALDLENKALLQMQAFFKSQVNKSEVLAAATDEDSKQVISTFQVPLPQACSSWNSGDDSAPEKYIATSIIDGVSHHIRLLSYVEGTVLSDFLHVGVEQLREVGKTAAMFSQGLSYFHHPSSIRKMQWDARISQQVVKALSSSVVDETLRVQVTNLCESAWECISPLEPHLRTQVIHGDLAHYNLVAERDPVTAAPRLSGAIDFGDVGEGWAVAELTTALAALLERDTVPVLDQAVAVVAGFHSRFPLTEAEVEAIWPLVSARACVLCVSVCRQIKIDPDNPYNVEEEARDWQLFERVRSIPFAVAEEAFRWAVGLPPSKAVLGAQAWLCHYLQGCSTGTGSRMLPSLLTADVEAAVTLVDFGVLSPALSDGAWLTPEGIKAAVESAAAASSTDSPKSQQLKLSCQGAENHQKHVVLGAYGEVRLINALSGDCHRAPSCVNLGVEVFLPEGTVVHAPADCVVTAVHAEAGAISLSVEDSTQLEIRISGIHASVGSVAAGLKIQAGAILGNVRQPSPGEVLPSHLRLQVVAVPCHHAAVPCSCPVSASQAWLSMCPNPAPLLGLEASTVQHIHSLHLLSAAALEMKSWSKDDITPGDDLKPVGDALMSRYQSVPRVQEHYFRHPPQIERGWGAHLFDTEGRTYLDVVNNVAVIGHSHPAVTEAATSQLKLLNTNSRFVYEKLGSFAQQIVATMPPGSGLDQVFLVNSGSEATDLAMRLARTYTGRRDVICLEGAYHGITTASDEVSTTLNDNPRSRETRPPWIHLVPMPNMYRGAWTGDDAGSRYADKVREKVQELQSADKPAHPWYGDPSNRGPAAFIAEPLSGNAGGVELPPGYLSQAYAAVRAAGGVCIADEVQVGYGRLGGTFWGFMEHGVTPDILTMAKAAGNGYPLGFVVTTKAIAEAMALDGSFFSSAGGGPVSCAVGSAVLSTIIKEELQANAEKVGAHLRTRLLELAKAHPQSVGFIHGHGLYMGVEIIEDAASKRPGTAQARAINDRLLELGVVCHATGDYSNVLKVKPPLCFSRENADFFVDTLDLVLTEREACL